jgi:hypothetical protein
MIFWVEPLGAVFCCPGKKRPKRTVVVRLGQAVGDVLRASPTLAPNPHHLSLFVQTNIGGPKCAPNATPKPVSSPRTAHFSPNQPQIWGGFGAKEDTDNVLPRPLARLVVTRPPLALLFNPHSTYSFFPLHSTPNPSSSMPATTPRSRLDAPPEAIAARQKGMAGSSFSRRHDSSSRGHGGIHEGYYGSSSRGHGGLHAGHHGSSSPRGGHHGGPSSTHRRSNPHGGFNRVLTRILDGTTEPPRRMRTRVSPEQAQRLFREYAEAPADAKMPDGWHLNPNRVSISSPPTGFARDRAIAEHRRLAGPEMAAYPRYAQNSIGWDELFAIEHELHRRSFFCPGSPPEWFTRESVSPSGSVDPDMAREEGGLLCAASEGDLRSKPVLSRAKASPRPCPAAANHHQRRRPHLHRLGAVVCMPLYAM